MYCTSYYLEKRYYHFEKLAFGGVLAPPGPPIEPPLIGTKCSVPSGCCKQFESSALIIRWYSTNYSLTIKGPESEELKGKMIAMASQNVDEASYDEDENETGLLKDSSSSGVYCQVMEELKLIEKRTDKFEDLSNKIHRLKSKDKISTSLSGEYLEHIKKEDSNLKEENKKLEGACGNFVIHNVRSEHKGEGSREREIELDYCDENLTL